jgi:aryl-alcohol dehydrogenase-like predicted oxidoreductase
MPKPQNAPEVPFTMRRGNMPFAAQLRANTEVQTVKHTLSSAGRREFLKTTGAAAAGLLTSGSVLAHPTTFALPPLPANSSTPASMPTRNLGKTGYKVAIFSLGGQAAIERPNNFDVAVPIIERALDLGVNYLDTSSIYGGPERWSEQYFGRVMKSRRHDAFLATKTKERTRDGSLRMIEKSLTLLNTDHVDLWQLHDIGLPEDVNAIFAKGGAMEALLEMQQQKVVRFLGVTGHYRPEALIDAISRHPFDAILMSLNAADAHIHSFSDQLLPLAVEKQMGIIGMKVPARGRLLSTWTPPPLEQQQHSWEGSAIATRTGVMNMGDAMHFTLTHPVSTVIVGCDNLQQLEENVQIAREFTPLSQTQVAALNELAAPVAKQSLFFRFTDRSRG